MWGGWGTLPSSQQDIGSRFLSLGLGPAENAGRGLCNHCRSQETVLKIPCSSRLLNINCTAIISHSEEVTVSDSSYMMQVSSCLCIHTTFLLTSCGTYCNSLFLIKYALIPLLPFSKICKCPFTDCCF